MRRSTKILALATAGVLALVGAPAAEAATSSNWAGYAVSGKSFRRVSATWVQPAADCSQSAGTYSAYWVGLGGLHSSSTALEQIGTEADCTAGGRARYSAWYELVPDVAVDLSQPTIRPGDRISARVEVSGHTVRLRLANLTTKNTFTKTLYAARIETTSAEWIVEAPALCDPRGQVCETQPLADFGAVTFSNARATTAQGHTGTVSDSAWKPTAIELAPTIGRGFGPRGFDAARAGGGGATPGDLSPSGASFSVSFASS